jgi:amino acid transporter
MQATAPAITDMIGIGPFITIPIFLSTMGGPQAMIGWLIGAILAFCDGLVWSELGAAMPKAGGSYHYLREAFGPAGAGRWRSFLIVWQIIFSAPPRGNFPHVSLVTLGAIASIFSLGRLPDVIVSLVSTRVLIQYLPQAIGLFILRYRDPDLVRPFRMWLYPVPGIVFILGWHYVLYAAARKSPFSIVFALVIFMIGSLIFSFGRKSAVNGLGRSPRRPKIIEV